MNRAPVINDPAIVAEVAAVFVAYEDALLANDVETMNRLFWNAPETVRYGIAEIQHGGDEIRAWREACEPVPPSRRRHRTVVTTFDANYATVSTEFTSDTTPLVGRQMQTWVRLGPASAPFGGWTIVAAHVSLIDAPDARAQGEIVGPIADKFREATKSSAPVMAEVTTIKSFKQEGCKRLNVRLTQANVPAKHGKLGEFGIDYGINLCRDGSPPTEGMDLEKVGKALGSGGVAEGYRY